MQSKIFSLIDLLLKMANTKNTYEELEAKRNLLLDEINNLKKAIDDLSSSMTDDKYFDASSEIVDRNIEISIVKKLANLEYEEEELEKKLDEKRKKEQDLLVSIEKLKERIVKSKSNMSLVDDRVKFAKNEDVKQLYSSLYQDEEKKSGIDEQELNSLNNDLKVNSAEMESLNQAISSVKEKCETLKARLSDVRSSLSNKKSYIDKSAMSKDKEELEALNKDLKRLEEEQSRILMNPVMLVSDIKDLIMSKDDNAALDKLKQLENSINEIPYMNIENKQDLLKELDRLKSQKDEIISSINDHEYVSRDITLIDNRISWLKSLIIYYKRSIKAYEEEIKYIDNNLVLPASKELKSAESEALNAEKQIDEYNSIINDESKSALAISTMKIAKDKKLSDFNVITDIANKYQTSIGLLIEKSVNLQNESISELEEKIEEGNAEINKLEELKQKGIKSKNAIKQEDDRKAAQKIDDDIKAINHRLTFDATPAQIIDDIEMMLTSNMNDSAKELTIAPNDKKEAEINNEKAEDEEVIPFFEITDDDSSTANEKPVENNANTENNKETVSNPIFAEINDDDEEQALKDTTNLDKDEDNKEYTLSQLDDTDYFDLDEFLKNLDEK